MELTYTQYERIQQYADGKMNPVEEQAFIAELDSDTTMREYLDLELGLAGNLDLLDNNIFSAALDQGNGSSNDDDIKALITEAGNAWKQKRYEAATTETASIAARPTQAKTITMQSRLVWLAVAASVLVVAAGIIWIVPTGKSTQTANIKTLPPAIAKPDTAGIAKARVGQRPDAGAIFKEYFTIDKLPEPGLRPELLASAFDDYDNGNYEKIRQLDLANLPKPIDDTRSVFVDSVNDSSNVQQLGHYYKAIALLENHKLDGAKTNLRWVLNYAASNTLKVNAKWYLALIYLQDSITKSQALPLLKTVAASRIKPFNHKANELLGKLGEEASPQAAIKSDTFKK